LALSISYQLAVGANACPPIEVGHAYQQGTTISSTFPTTLERSPDVLLPVVATKRQFDPEEDGLLIPIRGIEVLE
jgi:hypothetical protein